MVVGVLFGRAGLVAAWRVCAVALAALALPGCSALLPTGTARTLDSWQTYDEAQLSIKQINAFATLRSEIHAQGLDPAANSTITILNFADLMQRFAASTNLPLEELDRGVRECLRAGKRCTAYALNARRVDRKREGNFFLDIFNFKRETRITGWTYNALIVFVDDLVVYVLDGGQPQVRDLEVRVNPLGPFQGFAEDYGASRIR